jgi:hypothetical protein
MINEMKYNYNLCRKVLRMNVIDTILYVINLYIK